MSTNKIDWTKPIQTVYGKHPVTYLGDINHGIFGPCCIVRINTGFFEHIQYVTSKGSECGAGAPCVINVPPKMRKVTGFVNVYRSPYDVGHGALNGFRMGDLFFIDEERAKQIGGKAAVATVPVSFEIPE
jgi:hypothetical protein